jgi:tetratricopeptide (TPR) repeat protein
VRIKDPVSPLAAQLLLRRPAIWLLAIALVATSSGCDSKPDRPLSRKTLEGEPLDFGHGSAGRPQILVAPGMIDPDEKSAEPLEPSRGVLSSYDAGDMQVWERVANAATGFGAVSGGMQFAVASLPASGSKQTPFEKQLQDGVAALNAGKFRESIISFELAQRSDPNDYRGFFFEAVAQGQLDEVSRALTALDLAIRKAPQETELYVHRGNLRLRQKDYALAVDDFSQVIERDPKNLGALLNRAVANFHRRRPKDIIQDTTEVLAIRKDIPDAHLLRALGNLMSGEPARGRRDFDAAVAAGLSQQAVETWRPVFYREG